MLLGPMWEAATIRKAGGLVSLRGSRTVGDHKTKHNGSVNSLLSRLQKIKDQSLRRCVVRLITCRLKGFKVDRQRHEIKIAIFPFRLRALRRVRINFANVT